MRVGWMIISLFGIVFVLCRSGSRGDHAGHLGQVQGARGKGVCSYIIWWSEMSWVSFADQWTVCQILCGIWAAHGTSARPSPSRVCQVFSSVLIEFSQSVPALEEESLPPWLLTGMEGTSAMIGWAEYHCHKPCQHDWEDQELTTARRASWKSTRWSSRLRRLTTTCSTDRECFVLFVQSWLTVLLSSAAAGHVADHGPSMGSPSHDQEPLNRRPKWAPSPPGRTRLTPGWF